MTKKPSVAARVKNRVDSFLVMREINSIPDSYIRPTSRIKGRPIISIVPGSKLRIGERVVLISDPRMTNLAVNHPVTLRTLAPGATIIINSSVGISGGTICAAYHVRVGDGTMLGANVTIMDTDFHPIHSGRRRHEPMPSPKESDAVNIGENVFVGTGAIILKGTTIGDNSVIGAGSIVKGAFPDNAIIAGNPAKQVGTVDVSPSILAT